MNVALSTLRPSEVVDTHLRNPFLVLEELGLMELLDKAQRSITSG